MRRASGNDKNRIEKDIVDLKKEIGKLEKIKDGIKKEREPLKQRTVKGRTRFLNPPPLRLPISFQDRNIETGIISDFLKNDSRRMIALIGRGGIGKTGMVCRLLKSLETGLLPDDHGKFPVSGIIYLSGITAHKIGFANIFGDLCKAASS